MSQSKKTRPSKHFREKETNFRDSVISKLQTLSNKVSVVLVGPKYGGNIGAVSRSMNNAGLHDLIIIGRDDIPEEAYVYGMHSTDILDSARHFSSLNDLREEFNVIAASSSEVTFNGRKYRRLSYSPEEFWKIYLKAKGKIALVFGREDDGLRNEEIEGCDSFISIPANPRYPVYNLSHAVTIVLYEMVRQTIRSRSQMPLTSGQNVDLLIEQIIETLDLIKYPAHKRKNTEVMLRRLLSRSRLTETEFHKLMGIFRYIIFNLDDSDEKK